MQYCRKHQKASCILMPSMCQSFHQATASTTCKEVTVMLQFTKQQVISRHSKTRCWQNNYNHQHKYRISISCNEWCYHVMNHFCSENTRVNSSEPSSTKADYSTWLLKFKNLTLPLTKSSQLNRCHPKRKAVFEIPWFLRVYELFFGGGGESSPFSPFFLLAQDKPVCKL